MVAILLPSLGCQRLSGESDHLNGTAALQVDPLVGS
jgi:hypothetical protein